MRLKWILPILIGMLLGATIPAESTSTYVHRAYILPPSGYSGEVVKLNCGWHTGSCYSGAVGNFLDWGPTGTKNVYFRGIFTRGNSPTETNRLYGLRKLISTGSNVCDIQQALIIDYAEGKTRGIMQYTHTSMNSTASFKITTSSTGSYNSVLLGTMVYDYSSQCAWGGYHVHAGFMSGATSTRYKNGMYPSGDYCTTNCSKYTNNFLGNWTHYFLWSGL
jgi:hypothetical protein